ncbi:MAG: T9SS type A sorting domain-containing protein, partial [Bacteroidota bacterium]
SGFGHHPPLSISKLAEENGLSLTNGFVVRFQQAGISDFATNTAGTNPRDGFKIDEVKVYEEAVSYATLPFADDFETGMLGDAWAWRSAEETVLPLTGLVNPTSRFEVVFQGGLNQSYGVWMGRRCDQSTLLTANALDLHLALEGKKDVVLDFWIEDLLDDTDIQDGIYFSQDSGNSFVKVWDFDPDNWCNGFGHHPPLSISKLAEENGLSLTNGFVVRFQQIGLSDFATNTAGTNPRDGFKIDDVKVYEEAVSYASLPFADDFETGALGDAWAWRSDESTVSPLTDLIKPTARFELSSTLGINQSFAPQLGKRCDETNNFNLVMLDLHLDIDTTLFDSVQLSFYIRDWAEENQPQEGIYLSSDSGETFTKIFEYDFSLYALSTFTKLSLPLKELSDSVGVPLSQRTVIRFQQYDDTDFSTNTAGTNPRDGYVIDSVVVNGKPISSSNDPDAYNRLNASVFPNPATQGIHIHLDQIPSSGNAKYLLVDVNGQSVQAGVISNFETTVDVSNIASGFYFLSIQIGEQYLHKKVRIVK